MKKALKRILQAVAPRWTTAVLSARARAHAHRVVASWGCADLNDKLFDKLGDQVQDGPFKGLTLTQMTRAEQVGPCLLGTYESQLDEAWSVLFQGRYSRIIDIGAKFGYYAVGLARQFPSAEVVAFDTDSWARRAVTEMAQANGTPNVVVRGFCSPGWLADHGTEDSLVMSDCEGYESALFTPTVAKQLRTAALLIETHDHLVPGVSDTLRSAFAHTHLVRTFGAGAPRRQPSCSLDFLSDAERRLAVDEVRTNECWLLCLPKEGPNRHLLELMTRQSTPAEL